MQQVFLILILDYPNIECDKVLSQIPYWVLQQRVELSVYDGLQQSNDCDQWLNIFLAQ